MYGEKWRRACRGDGAHGEAQDGGRSARQRHGSHVSLGRGSTIACHAFACQRPACRAGSRALLHCRQAEGPAIAASCAPASAAMNSTPALAELWHHEASLAEAVAPPPRSSKVALAAALMASPRAATKPGFERLLLQIVAAAAAEVAATAAAAAAVAATAGQQAAERAGSGGAMGYCCKLGPFEMVFSTMYACVRCRR